ncbi:class I SAM-dependent methyltransferase [Nocardia sp. NPDC004168]|uniref:class I SAM-dependent methyltransferase n=1 Tax=Nocardia sp. NPDC004168 TaxID=3154452 RepID=UPI0033AA21C6
MVAGAHTHTDEISTSGRRRESDARRVGRDPWDEFFFRFLDPTRTYSCALWNHPEDTLEQAQLNKIDLALGKCDLRPGMTLLDVGCGWGSALLRAMDTRQVNTIGLTVSRSQYRYVRDQLARGHPCGRVWLQGWEAFDGHADRIVCIDAFEYFHHDSYGEFFQFAHHALPVGGVLLLQTIVGYHRDGRRAHAIEHTGIDDAFMQFLTGTVFAGGPLPAPTGRDPKGVTAYAEDAGFTVTVTGIQAMGPHYATTLDHWASALHEHRDHAIELTGTGIYNAYIRYLTGCADYARRGHIDVMQFTCTKPGTPH